MHLFIFTIEKMYNLHKTTSAVSCVKPNANQWEVTLRDDVWFATVYRRIYRRKFLTLSNQTSRYIRECNRMPSGFFYFTHWAGQFLILRNAQFVLIITFYRTFWILIQTLKTLISCCILQCLIWVNIVCQCAIYGTYGVNRLSIFIRDSQAF